MAPLVSVVLPVYAPHPRFFREAVESVLAQTFSDLELIIVEDPSPSRGVEILQGMTDSRVRHIVNPSRTSLPEQHNHGLAVSRGTFICRFDADDVAEPHRVERQVTYLQAHPEIGVVASAVTVIDESGRPIARRHYPQTHDEIRRTFRRSNPIANSAVMFRRSVYERFGGWRTDSRLPAQDYEWYSRLAAGGVRFANLEEALVRYRLHETSIKSTKLRDTIRSTIETKRRYWLSEMNLMDRAIMAAESALLIVPPKIVFTLFKWLRYRRV